MILNVDLPPKVADRTRSSKGRHYNTPQYSEWLDTASQLMAIEYRDVSRRGSKNFYAFGPIERLVSVRYGWAKDHFTVEVLPSDIVRPKGLRGDIDNYVKAGNDALQQAGVIENDKQVVALSAAFVTEE